VFFLSPHINFTPVYSYFYKETTDGINVTAALGSQNVGGGGAGNGWDYIGSRNG
jgi:hypothetical protein